MTESLIVPDLAGEKVLDMGGAGEAFASEDIALEQREPIP